MIQFLLKHQLKNLCLSLSVIAIQFFLMFPSHAQTLVTSVEAESGSRAGGLTIATANAGYSGSGYVTNMNNGGDNLTIPVSVPTAGNYKLVIRYNGPYGPKDQDVYVNGVFVSSLNFPATTGYTDLAAGSITLNAGSNTIGIYKNWGYTDFDKVTLYTVPLHDYTTVATTPIDPAATKETVALYNYLKSNYGQTILSGQTSDTYATVSPNAAKKPVIRAYDFQHYTVGYSYLWNNTTNSHGFGWEDDGTTQDAIDWYNTTCQKGIVAFHWHWHSPSGGQAGTNTFYTNSTTFDVSKAVTVGTTEYTAVIRDIDSIATQLKKLQAAGVPVMWRPLHEAGGAWFWWGAKGSVAALKLYDMVYDRLVNHHAIHNLIWQWSTPEPSWYPGNAKVDMLGYDSYPGPYVYGTQKLIFDQLYTIVNGQKMLAMTENGPIPDPDACFTSDAKWSYFMSWSDLVTQQNSAAQLSLVYNHAKVTTLDEVTVATNTAQLTAAGPTSFCTGGSVLLKANVAKGYTYKWYNGTNVISGATSSSYTATTAGSYTVSVTATGTCTTTSSAVVVTVGGPGPTITPATATTFCQGGSVVLNANTGSGYTYQWNAGGNPISGATNASYTANTTGLYSVKITVSTCNATSAGTQVTVNGLPTATITAGGSTTFCQGSNVVLTASTGSSYKWMLGGNSISGATNATYTANTTGSYTVEVTNASNCKATSAVTTVTVNALPTAAITTGTNTSCGGISVLMTASTGTSYKWMLNGTAISGATNATFMASTTGPYTVEVTNASGCKAVSPPKNFPISSVIAPSISPDGQVAFCNGGNIVLTASAGSAYRWMLNNNVIPAATNATYTATSPGSYTVEVTNGPCTLTSQPTTVSEFVSLAAITANGPTSFCQGGNVVLTANMGSAYKWMNGGNAISGATNVSYTASTSGSYTVEVTYMLNCKATSNATQVDVVNSATWYLDTDGDGKGELSASVQACIQPNGYVAVAGDACPNDMNKIAPGNCGCGETESSCVSTATKSALATNIKMYPNPTTDNCKIELPGSEFQVTIYTASGVQISSGEYTNEAIVGNGLSQGIYLVRIEQDGNVELRKLIKQ